MTDYTDYRVWRDTELWGDKEYLQDHQEYSPEDVFQICNSLIEKAVKSGLEGCYLKFSSHMEPYDDCLGPPSISACGYRRASTYEKDEAKTQDEMYELAESLGITFYEATILTKLHKDGKVTLTTT